VLVWSRLCSFFRRGLSSCGGGPISKGVGLILPLFFWSAWARSLWWRADRQGRWSGLAYVPLVGMGSVTVVSGYCDSRSVEISELPSIQRSRQNNRGRKIAENLRSRYKEYFCGECAVDWQEKMIRLDQIVFKMCKSINPKTFIELFIGNVWSVKRYIIFTYK
jgi:hypothetical protein